MFDQFLALNVRAGCERHTASGTIVISDIWAKSGQLWLMNALTIISWFEAPGISDGRFCQENLSTKEN